MAICTPEHCSQISALFSQVDQYLFLFLKFIAAVIPTMEYDYTLPADFS